MAYSLKVEVQDPIVAELIRLVEKRSNDGAKEYGFKSILERADQPLTLVSDALEESIDQLIYLGAALALLREERRIQDEEDFPDESPVSDHED